MLRILALFAIVGAMLIAASALVGCNMNNQSSLKALKIAHRTVISGNNVADAICKTVLDECIKNKENPCKNLTLCHEKRAILRKALLSAEIGVKASLDAMASLTQWIQKVIVR